MDATTYYEAPNDFYKVEEGGKMVLLRRNQFFRFRKKRGRGSTRFEREKKHTRQILLPMWRGRPEDAVVR
jgi:hypothetical protein